MYLPICDSIANYSTMAEAILSLSALLTLTLDG